MMKQRLLQLLLLLMPLCGGAGFIASAQGNIEKSTEKVRIGGEVYYIHVVKKGETLYSLSKAYQVSVEQLTAANPELANGLKEGQRLKIPAVVANAPPAAMFVPLPPAAQEPGGAASLSGATAEKPAYHIVKPGETLWSIAEKYGTTADELRRNNPDAFFNDALMSDALLQILPASEPEASTTSAAGADSLPKVIRPTYLEIPSGDEHATPAPLKRPLRVALLLPLLEPAAPPADSLAADSIGAVAAPAINTDNYYAFYKGALLAIEALKPQGLSLQLSVFDTYSESSVQEALAGEELPQSDLIIGPVYANRMKPVAQFAGAHGIKIVSPLDPETEEQSIGHPGFFQVSPSTWCRQKKLIDDVLARENAHILLITDASGGDSLLVEQYKVLFAERLNEVRIYPHSVAKGTVLRDSLISLLKPGKTNCVLVASNREALVSDVAANLYLFTARQRYPIILYGTERWRNFESVDLKYFHALNLHLVVPFFIDYEKDAVKQFVATYQDVYKVDPSQYAFQGFDTFSYFLPAIMRYGLSFEPYLNRYRPELLQAIYRFQYNGSYRNGLVNVESCLIRYTPDYTIERR
jgi:LysM repeat protein